MNYYYVIYYNYIMKLKTLPAFKTITHLNYKTLAGIIKSWYHLRLIKKKVFDGGNVYGAGSDVILNSNELIYYPTVYENLNINDSRTIFKAGVHGAKEYTWLKMFHVL